MPEEFITKKGLEKLKNEYEELVSKRPQVAERLKEAVSFGDLSENAEYIEAKDEQAFIEGRILEIESILRTVRLVQSSATRKSYSEAQIGCAVHLASGGQRKKFRLVGKGEGNPLNGQVSSDSPLGQAVLGKRIGDVITVSTPGGNKKYKVVKLA